MSVVRIFGVGIGLTAGADCCNSVRRQRKIIPVIDLVVFSGVIDFNDVDLSGSIDHVERNAAGVGTV